MENQAANESILFCVSGILTGMSLMKTKVDAQDVLSFLQADFDRDIKKIDSISGGEMSQAFSFRSKSQDFIIRINMYPGSFVKDKYAYDTFANSQIPVPKVFKIGKLNNMLYFCISERINGKTLTALEEKAKTKIYPQLMGILDAIHSVNIAPGKYGWWEREGIAEFDTWKSYIRKNLKVGIDAFYKDTFLEKDFIVRLFDEMHKLTDRLPEERYLIHGDFGGSNVVTDGDTITGIIDWGNSAFGDFLYDVAYQEFWKGQYEISNKYREHYKKTAWNIEHYDERIQCYLLHIGIGVLEFWARAGLEANYKMTKKRILEYL